ncbi:MAG TPA: exodeoxyribonuclease VII large subunit [Myxococcaceae bacterium]|nr:exodeoxyribonuclease VII large subunit [Myxococcaceae bacterium]
MPVKKVKSLVPSAPSTLQGDLFGQPGAAQLERAPPGPGGSPPAPAPPGELEPPLDLVPPPGLPLPELRSPVRTPGPRREAEPLEPQPPTELALSRETVRVDLEPARPRERGASVRWTSTTEVVRIETPASTPAIRPPERVVLTVTQLTQAVKGVLAEGFRRVLVRGEVTSFRGLHASGHLFFKLKDAGASIDVKIWASVVQRLRFRLEEGMEVIAEGNLDVYEKAGQYNLIIQRIEPSGAGALAIAFAQLRDRLTAQGLMGEKRLRPPRPLPFLPWRIGVVTSRSGAALHDFLRVLHRRNPTLSVLLCHARVQGPGAAHEVVRALQRLARTDVDVIVVTRGGGSAEDLWTFNEEAVARAIAASPVPVVSAVGHEVDFTIADFVADARAPTPSAAAELLAPELEALLDDLRTARTRLRQAVGGSMAGARERLRQHERRLRDPRQDVTRLRHGLIEQERALGRLWTERLRSERARLMDLRGRLERFRPEALLGERRARLERLRWRLAEVQRARLSLEAAALGSRRQRLERRAPDVDLARARTRLAGLTSRLGQHAERRLGLARAPVAEARARLERAMRARLAQAKRAAEMHAGRLDGLSPLRVMARGYAVVYRIDDGHLVRRAGELQPGASVRLRWAPPGCASLGSCDEAEATVTQVKPGGDEGDPPPG